MTRGLKTRVPETAAHLCIDMQRMFVEGTEWHTPWAAKRFRPSRRYALQSLKSCGSPDSSPPQRPMRRRRLARLLAALVDHDEERS